MADGKVTDAEVKAQEKRVVKLLKEIEPQLDAKLHDRVTELAVRADGLRHDADAQHDAASRGRRRSFAGDTIGRAGRNRSKLRNCTTSPQGSRRTMSTWRSDRYPKGNER